MNHLTAAAHCPEEPRGGAVRVEVLRVLDPVREIVFFSCAAGSAPGRWMGAEPAHTGFFDIEFEVPDDITEWTSAATASGISGTPEAGAEVRVECEVERVGDGDDSVVAVRLGSGILLVEVPDGRSSLTAGDLISFRTSEILLHPYFA